MNCDTPTCNTTADVYRSFSSNLAASGDHTPDYHPCCDEAPAATIAKSCCIYAPLLWNELLSHHIDG